MTSDRPFELNLTGSESWSSDEPLFSSRANATPSRRLVELAGELLESGVRVGVFSQATSSEVAEADDAFQLAAQPIARAILGL